MTIGGHGHAFGAPQLMSCNYYNNMHRCRKMLKVGGGQLI